MHRKSPRSILRFFLVQLLALWATPAASGGIFTQIVVPFTSERPVQSRYDKGEHALVLSLQKTAPNELAAFDHYDERLIKRLVIKDLGSAGCEVKLILRDRDVRANVSQFTEPFRIAIDVFDADYEEEHDPETGMPLVASKSEAQGASGRKDSGVKLAEKHGEGRESDLPEQAAEAPKKAQGSGKKRQLLEPTGESLAAGNGGSELSAEMNQASDGVGKAWQDYPPYMYRLQTAAYEEKTEREKAAASKAQNSVQQMADYAGKLFSFGQEAKALLAYQQVLHKDPSLFDRDALHLWKLSEIHFGQANYTLAQGYFEALLQKHPESPLAHFARLRLMDIAVLRKISEGNYQGVSTLLPRLAAIPTRGSGELSAQVAIRQAWWAPEAVRQSQSPKDLPRLNANLHNALMAAYPLVESSRTAFLAATLLLNNMLGEDQPWQRSTGEFAAAYFKRFTGAAAEPYRSELKDLLQERLSASLQAKATAGRLLEATADYEALPPSLRSIKKDGKTSWAVAESYRKLGQRSKAIPFYEAAAAALSEGPARFKAQFYLAETAGEEAEELRQAKADQAKTAGLAEQSRKADKAAQESWKRLTDGEKEQLSVAYKEPFEKTINSPAKLKTGLTIVLATWSKALNTKTTSQTTPAPGPRGGEWSRNFSPSGAAVILLTDLSKRFGQLGMASEKRQATDLLKLMKPKDFPDDQAAKQIWAAELINLAEDYRKANQYLDAGRLFNLVGSEAENFDGRAEALYKGGLLLYRSGRRAEAIDAFKKAEADGNNLFYANLAKERLSQLQ